MHIFARRLMKRRKVSTENWKTSQPGFKQWNTKAFTLARKQQCVRKQIQVTQGCAVDLAIVVKEDDGILDPVFFSQRLQLFKVGDVRRIVRAWRPGDDQFRLQTPLAQSRRNLDSTFDIFSSRQTRWQK